MENVEVVNPLDPDNRETLIQAVAEAKELVTALPSFRLYNEEPAPAARLLAEGLTRKCKRPDLSPAVVYAAENDMRAAARLEAFCWDHAPAVALGIKWYFPKPLFLKCAAW